MRRALAKVAQMPKFYAVSKGREGPKVYKTWDECKENVSRFPGAVHKAFSSMEQAETWLASSLSLQTSNPSQTVPRSTDPRRSQRPYNQDKRLRLNVPSQIPSAPSSSSNAEASTSSMSLSAEQQAVLERVSRGQSTFFSGSAGTGITASTGIAGINIGGTTLHSWAGIGIGNEPAKKIGGMFLGQQKYERVLKRWRTVKTLIIDEISMVDGALFDKLVWPGSTQYMYWRSELIKQEEIARIVRKKDAPFGGIQLPPVPNKHGDKVTPIVFAFDSKTWATCVGPPVTLTHVFRQKDQAFVDLLNAMRFGKVENVEAFKALERKVTYTDGIQPTEL
ncbi:hypothetical protein C8F04DRAFT_84082 [Mycena alexandri]|uniref:ATP-dependent DNA helicase n=1 Tax=Mycena alexandri TaxID=1745969 RepID=A0AAD6TC00_9AGAR|nr:hypothetical protein C8F04DRAFT_84082 [Mycena alexandri]